MYVSKGSHHGRKATYHMEAAQNLNEYNKDILKKLEDDKLKLKKQQQISEEEWDEKVMQMLNKASCKVGIAPITKKQVQNMYKSMTEKGILKRTEPLEIRM